MATTVLVADDDRAIRTVLTQALGRQGYDVRTTGNAATLWRWVEDGDGDLVITDVVMPGINGPTLAQHLIAVRPDLRVLFMSGYGDAAASIEGGHRNNVAFLGKPFQTAALAERVQALLATRKQVPEFF